MKIFQVGLICILYFIENFDFNLIIFSYIMDVVVTFQMEMGFLCTLVYSFSVVIYNVFLLAYQKEKDSNGIGAAGCGNPPKTRE